MNKAPLVTAVIITILLGFIKTSNNEAEKLVSPGIDMPVRETPTPTPTPAQFFYNSSTNLKDELDTVNPEVKSTDFQNLKAPLPSL